LKKLTAAAAVRGEHGLDVWDEGRTEEKIDQWLWWRPVAARLEITAGTEQRHGESVAQQ
jgi:hypothetical protein